MDKQTFYSELSDRLDMLGVGRNYIERHLKQFDSYFDGKNDEEISHEIERLGDLDRVAARIKRMTDKLMEQEQTLSPDSPAVSDREVPLNTTDESMAEPLEVELPPEQTQDSSEKPVTESINSVSEPVLDDDDVISFTPINREDVFTLEPDGVVSVPDEEITEQETRYHGRRRGDLAISDPGRIVKTIPDEETVRKNTKKFWLLFALAFPIILAVVTATAATFALVFFAIAVLIIAFVAALVAVTAAGTLISVFGLIFGVAQMMSSLPIGLYECGLSIIIGASAMFVGILLYNIAVRLLPYSAKWLLALLKLIFRKYKELFVYLKKECIGL